MSVKPDAWRRAVLDSELPPTTKLIAVALGEFADYRDGTDCRPGLVRLAALASVDRSTVVRHRAALERAGWIVLEGARGSNGPGAPRASTYRLAIPDQLPSATGEDSPTGAPVPPVQESTGAPVPPVDSPTGAPVHPDRWFSATRPVAQCAPTTTGPNQDRAASAVPAVGELGERAARLVSRERGEVPAIVSALVAEHGPGVVGEALDAIDGRNYAWPSALGRALGAKCAALASERARERAQQHEAETLAKLEADRAEPKAEPSAVAEALAKGRAGLRKAAS